MEIPQHRHEDSVQIHQTLFLLEVGSGHETNPHTLHTIDRSCQRGGTLELDHSPAEEGGREARREGRGREGGREGGGGRPGREGGREGGRGAGGREGGRDGGTEGGREGGLGGREGGTEGEGSWR